MNSFIDKILLILLSTFLTSVCFAKENKQLKPYELVTNLSSLLEYNSPQLPQSKTIPFEKLESNDAILILAKDQQTESITWLPNKGIEKRLIAEHKANVSRSAKTLTIKTLSGPPIKFRNMYKPEGKTRDGDSTEFIYAGMLATIGYHMVEADYMHDTPGTYFINQKTGSMLYAHTGTHSTFLSKNSRLLVTSDSLNPPFGLVVAVISDQGHKIEVHCLSNNRTSDMHALIFKGWHESDVGFDLVLEKGREKINKKTAPQKLLLPIQFKLISGQWHIYSQEDTLTDLSSKLTCWQ